MKNYKILATTAAGTVISFGHICYVTLKPWNGGTLTGPMIEVEKSTAQEALDYLASK